MADHGVVCSMSRSGNVWDNAAMESFFSSLKSERTARKLLLSNSERSEGRCVRLRRTLLKSKATAFDDRIPEPYGVRAEGRISLSACQRNRVQPIEVSRSYENESKRFELSCVLSYPRVKPTKCNAWSKIEGIIRRKLHQRADGQGSGDEKKRCRQVCKQSQENK